MKSFERIFLYSMLAILFFYVFLIDGNVESQEAIQEEIRARRIVIVNDAGQEVVTLLANAKNNGAIVIGNKDGTPLVFMGDYGHCDMISIVNENFIPIVSIGHNGYGGRIVIVNKYSKLVANMEADEYGGVMGINNLNGTPAAFMANKYNGGGKVGTYNKDGNPSVIMSVSGNDNDDGAIFFYNKYGKLSKILPLP